MSILEDIIGIDTGHYILQLNEIKSLKQKNKLFEHKIKEFKPVGFFNILKRIFLGLDSFSEVKKLKDEIKINKQLIVNIEKDILAQEVFRLDTDVDLFIEKIVRIESEYIQKRKEQVIVKEAKELNRRLLQYKSELKNMSKKNWVKIKEIMNTCEQWRSSSNQKFISGEKKKFKHYFDQVESNPLTAMQQEAVVTNEENNLVLAGAGSGKTSVIIAKVGYILKKNFANSNEILILAFNKKAQEELSERIEEKLDVSVTAKTFHSFGLKIIANATNEKPSLCTWAEDQSKLTELIQNIINHKLIKDTNFYEQFSKYFISYFVPYKSHEEFNNFGECNKFCVN